MRTVREEKWSLSVSLEQVDMTVPPKKNGGLKEDLAGKVTHPAESKLLYGGISACESLELRRKVKAAYVSNQYKQEFQALGKSGVCLESPTDPLSYNGKWLSRQFSNMSS